MKAWRGLNLVARVGYKYEVQSLVASKSFFVKSASAKADIRSLVLYTNDREVVAMTTASLVCI